LGDEAMTWLWPVTKRVAHALGWLWVLAIPAALVAEIVTGLLADPLSMPDAWLKPGIVSKISIVVECLAVGTIIAAALLVWISAIRGRWSLKWPLLVLLVVLGPFGFALFVISMIGLGKLIIWAVGRGSTTDSSRLREPAVAVRPCGLVEYATHD